MSHRGEKILRVGTLLPVSLIHPQLNSEYTAHLVCRQIFEPLYNLPAPAQQIRPLLLNQPLEQLSSSKEAQIFSARLRSDVKFSDATPLEPEHVINSLNHEAFRCPAEVSAKGNCIIFHLERPDTNFHLKLTQIACAPTIESNGKLLGTGPFHLLANSTPECIYLERNPHYRFAVPLDGIIFKAYPPDKDGSKRTLTEAVKSGEIDLTTFLDKDDLSQLSGLRKWLEPGSSLCNLYMNTERDPFNNAAVRKAIAMSIDRMKLAAACFGNALAFAARGPLPPMMGNWHDLITYNPQKAKLMLQEMGLPAFRKYKMVCPWGPRPYVPYPIRMISLLREMLGVLGIKFDTVVPEDLNDYRRHIISGDYDFALLGWIADSPDPMDFLEAIYASSSVPDHISKPAFLVNDSRWRNADMDAAIKAYRAEPLDSKKYIQERILAILSDEVPVIPLMYGPTLGAHTFKVKNLKPHPLPMVSLGKVDFW